MLKVALPRSIRPIANELPGDLDLAWYVDGSDCPAAAAEAEVLWLSMWRTAEIESTLRSGRHLRWVSTSDAGVDSFPLRLFRERGITLTNGRGLHAIPVAEYVVMAMLAAAKGFPSLVRAQDRAEWLPSPPARGELQGTRALIVGYGSIGQAVAERVRPFGVEIFGVRRTPAASDASVIGPDAWRSRLHEFDWIVLCTPLTGSTRSLIGASELAGMKPTAWVLNVARGSMIHTAALEAAVGEGRIGGAYLDLTDPEPLPPDSPLWHMPNVIVTPHSSHASAHSGERAMALFLDNLARYRSGLALRNIVNLDAGY